MMEKYNQGIETGTSKQDEAEAILKDKIIFNEFPQGMPLVERNLCDMLNMSRTPIRGALLSLCRAGLVTAIPGKGMYVSTVDQQDIEEIYGMRALVDTAVMVSFVKNAGPDQIGQAREYIDRMYEAAKQGETETMNDYDILFHQYYTDHCGNNRLAALLNSVTDLFCRFRYIITTDKDMNLIFANEHLLIMDAIAANDQAEAELQMKAHYSHLKRYHLRRHLNRKPRL